MSAVFIRLAKGWHYFVPTAVVEMGLWFGVFAVHPSLCFCQALIKFSPTRGSLNLNGFTTLVKQLFNPHTKQGLLLQTSPSSELHPCLAQQTSLELCSI